MFRHQDWLDVLLAELKCGSTFVTECLLFASQSENFNVVYSWSGFPGSIAFLSTFSFLFPNTRRKFNLIEKKVFFLVSRKQNGLIPRDIE